MKNKNKDWHDYKLLDDEVEMLESIERGEWKSIDNIEKRHQTLRRFFSDKPEYVNNLNRSTKNY
ncbi:MAG: hypothetical protein ABSG15_06505 [FCB group bacterium]